MSDNPCNQSHIKYGQITGNEKINRFICCFFEYLCEKDQRKFKRYFRNLPPESDQVVHTLRELILGAHLSANGYQVRHDYTINNQTPDWCILDDESEVTGIVELTNFHIDKTTESKIREQSKIKENFSYWRDGNRDNIDRLYHCIDRKAQAYRSLVKSRKIPYVVAVFGEWETAVDFDEIRYCLLGKEIGLFKEYPEMSGILYFVEQNALRYLFNYAENPNPLKPITLPSGVFSPGAA